MIKDNIEKILNEINGFNTKLICVSKTRSNDEIMEAYNIGMRDFGENHVKELCEKRKTLPKDIRWHMIGHLQTNKVKELLDENVFLIHSVDSIKLAKEINKRCKNKQDILLEINIANEESKYGFSPNIDELKNVMSEIKTLDKINCIGLMCVAPNTLNPEDNDKYFKLLKELGNTLNLNILSMGMTNDYLIACQNDSSYIRVGTGIFGERDYTKKEVN